MLSGEMLEVLPEECYLKKNLGKDIPIYYEGNINMRKYIKSYEEYDDRIDPIIINPEDVKYYDRQYEVGLWGGAGYQLEIFRVYASDAYNALDKVVAYCEKKGFTGLLFEVDEVPEDAEEEYIYVDATMEGASRPYFVLPDNA